MTLPVRRYSAQGVRPFDDIYSEFDRPLKSVIEGSAQAGLVVHAEREDLLRAPRWSSASGTEAIASVRLA